MSYISFGINFFLCYNLLRFRDTSCLLRKSQCSKVVKSIELQQSKLPLFCNDFSNLKLTIKSNTMFSTVVYNRLQSEVAP